MFTSSTTALTMIIYSMLCIPFYFPQTVDSRLLSTADVFRVLRKAPVEVITSSYLSAVTLGS